MSNLETTTRILELESQAVALLSKLATLENSRSLDLYTPDEQEWVMFATTLVLFMTIPGLALYYAGINRAENVLATTMQLFGITCIVTFLWQAFGYSLAFAPASADQTGNIIFGDGSRLWLEGITLNKPHQLMPHATESIFCLYQLTFAIITPCIICGSIIGRMNFGPILLFFGLWHLIVYCPIAHMVWHSDGFLFKAGVMDTAGGLVVHLSGGMSALIATLVVGNRLGYGDPKEADKFEPYNIIFTFIGNNNLLL